MKLSSALGGGIAGAVTLTLLHETVRRHNPDAPRMDLLGMEAVAKALNGAEVKVPEKGKLFKITMAGDILSNSIYYSLAGVGNAHQAILRGIFLGLAAGIGAVYLPKPLGLAQAPSNRTLQTKLMTVTLYSAGGAVAGVVSKVMENEDI